MSLASVPPVSGPAADVPFAASWARVGVVVGWIIALIGDPRALATRWRLPKRLRRLGLVWLRLAEALARRLLAAMAARIGPDNAPPPGFGRCGPSSGHGRGGFAHEDPSRWAITARHLLAPPASSPRRDRPAKRRPAALRCEGLPLAERLEALLRVVADPLRFVRRAARARERRARRGLNVTPAWRGPDRLWPVWRDVLGEPGPEPSG